MFLPLCAILRIFCSNVCREKFPCLLFNEINSNFKLAESIIPSKYNIISWYCQLFIISTICQLRNPIVSFSRLIVVFLFLRIQVQIHIICIIILFLYFEKFFVGTPFFKAQFFIQMNRFLIVASYL